MNLGYNLSDYEQYKSLCQVVDCGKPAVTELGKNNNPYPMHYKDWIPYCRKHGEEVKNGIQLELLDKRRRVKVT